MNKQKTNQYTVEITQSGDAFRLSNAYRLDPKGEVKRVNARSLARQIRRTGLVTR